jgi:hypothetical protein
MRRLVFGTSSLDRTVAALEQGHVPHEINNRCITIDAGAELGCVLEFEAA